MAKLLSIQEPDEENGVLKTVAYMFDCPGCGMSHEVYISPYKNAMGASWAFTGSFDKPTFFPSINAKAQKDSGELIFRCHSFVEDGMIRFLDDCTHSLAGKTVELPDV